MPRVKNSGVLVPTTKSSNMRMFKIDEGFIEARHVASVMWLLDGLVYNLRIVPVTDVKKTKKGLVEQPTMSAAEAILGIINSGRTGTVTRSEIIQAMTAAGLRPSNSGINSLIKAKRLKRTRKEGVYTIIPEKHK